MDKQVMRIYHHIASTFKQGRCFLTTITALLNTVGGLFLVSSVFVVVVVVVLFCFVGVFFFCLTLRHYNTMCA